ncbi:MAG: FkbM family methyltransferase [Betaproteobacteria bacterium]
MGRRRDILELAAASARLRDHAGAAREANWLYRLVGAVRARARRKLVDGWRRFEGAYVPLQDGTLFFVPRELDLHGYTVLTKGDADQVNAPILARFCAPGNAVIDVGANIGELTVPFARSVGAGGACLAIEPIPFLADAVRRTAFANGLDWVEVFQCAASADAASANLELRYREGQVLDTGGSRLVDAAPTGTIQVATERLDDIVRRSRIGARRVSLIKVDVEGHELPVLRGAEGTLRQHRPALAIEVGNETPAARAEMVALLQGLGYEPVGALFRHAVLPVTWRALHENTFPLGEDGVVDILFRTKGP